MGFWNLYFIAKLGLFARGSIQPVWWLNVLFALALLVPLRQRWQRRERQPGQRSCVDVRGPVGQ